MTIQGRKHFSSIDDKINFVAKSIQLLQLPWQFVIVTLGADGVLLVQDSSKHDSTLKETLVSKAKQSLAMVTHFPAISTHDGQVKIENVTGSGDRSYP